MIAVCGECLIDFIPQPNQTVSPTHLATHSQKISLPSYRAFIGGSPLNTAIAIARLNTPVTMISRLSRDAFGESIIQHLMLNRVGTNTLSRGDEPTTIGFVIPQKSRGEDFVFYAQHSADRFIRVKHLPRLADKITHLHFSSIALQMEPCATTYEWLMRKEFRRRTLSLDPNVRPLFIEDRKKYLARVERIISMVGVFRASDQDLKYLYPRITPEVAFKKILPRLRAPRVGVLTQGNGGATVFFIDADQKNRIQKIHTSIKKIQVVDTVGAGDTFTGAFLYILYHHGIIGKGKMPSPNISLATILKQALEFAIRAAAINCSREGCDPAFIKELNEY